MLKTQQSISQLIGKSWVASTKLNILFVIVNSRFFNQNMNILCYLVRFAKTATLYFHGVSQKYGYAWLNC